MRTVFVFISGMTTFTGLGGAAGFFGSGLVATGVGGGGGGATGAGWALTVGRAFGAGCVLATEGVEAGFPASWTFPDPIDVLECETAGLDMMETGVFLAGAGVGRLAGEDGTTFLTAGLAILLVAGVFLADLLAPDEWTGFTAAFLTGTIFLTWTAFLAGLAAFFLVAIQLGFFCNKHF
ncbi:MAG TPA: hypothetical protein VN963_10510 [bacterium]|nr:hypothetical protein [bacterium]